MCGVMSDLVICKFKKVLAGGTGVAREKFRMYVYVT